jgi:phosphoribosyl-ATP pyrophosphohydrolase
MITASGHFLRTCDCGCKFILMPYHLKQRDPYARWHRPTYDLCHQCFRKWEKKIIEERVGYGMAAINREVQKAKEKAADLTFKVWGIGT